jgi:hypothetical protein
MQALNMRDPYALRHIPEEFHAHHEFCFRIHDLMVEVCRQAEEARIAAVRFNLDGEEQKALMASDDVYRFLVGSGREDLAKRLTLNHVAIPLYADILNFIYEGLRALEKRKVTVSFALFRKPLKYGLLLASWLYADEDDFFAKMEKSPADEMNDRKVPEERRIELLEKSIAAIGEAEFFDATYLHGLVFDRANAAGFASYFDMATHYITTHRAMRTDPLNFNFIFKNPDDNDTYEGIYFPLGYVLMYLLLLEMKTMSRMGAASESYVSWATATMMGSFEALFREGETPYVKALDDALGPLLRCLFCKQQMRVARENAPRLLMAGRIVCPGCGQDQEFPLFWLMSGGLDHFASAAPSPDAAPSANHDSTAPTATT